MPNVVRGQGGYGGDRWLVGMLVAIYAETLRGRVTTKLSMHDSVQQYADTLQITHIR